MNKTGNQTLTISGFDAAVINDIARDSAGGNWQALIPVYKMPADTDMKNYQPVQPGVYHLQQNAVVFTPDTPFIKGQTYFVRYYNLQSGSTLNDLIGNHNRPGNLHYVDLTFK